MEHIPLETGVSLLLEHVFPPTGEETLAPEAAVGRVLARDLFTPLDFPPFDRSPLDGYALRSSDLTGACPEAPARMTAGDRVSPGTAVPVDTGSPMPGGADCVVPIERTRRIGTVLEVFTELSPWRNYIFRGEDKKAGSLLFPAGTRLTWKHIPALAAQGIRTVTVRPKPRVGVLSAGQNLIPAGQPLPHGGVYDVNTPMLSARLADLGAEPLFLTPCPGGPNELAERIRAALAGCDLLLTTGGASVGDRDSLARAAERLGAERLFHGLAVRPGSPALAFTAEGTPVLALSGNPYAALAVFEAVGRPAVEKLAGSRMVPRRRAFRLESELPPSPVRRLIRGVVTSTGGVIPAPGGHASGMVWSLSASDCLMDRPAGAALKIGTPVEVLEL